jgi:hypothetical protein
LTLRRLFTAPCAARRESGRDQDGGESGHAVTFSASPRQLLGLQRVLLPRCQGAGPVKGGGKMSGPVPYDYYEGTRRGVSDALEPDLPFLFPVLCRAFGRFGFVGVLDAAQ